MTTKETIDICLSEEYRKQLGTILKELRLNYNKRHSPVIKQEDIANLLHVERQYVSRLENGHREADYKDLICYSCLFDINIDTIICKPKKYIESLPEDDVNCLGYFDYLIDPEYEETEHEDIT